MRRWCWLAWALLLCFVVTLFGAVLVYPGGSWTEPQALGFSLARNFWCDLLRSRAINGLDNHQSKLLASVGFAALGLAMFPYWWVAAGLLPRARRGRVALFGMLSATSLAALARLPSDEQPLLHGIVALCGGITGIACAAVCVVTRLAHETGASLRRVSGALALVLGSLNAVLYVYVAYGHGQETLAQPLVQKFATIALLLWMWSTLSVAERRACPAPSSG
jgi:hypothetical protein